jgi:hypothetical protein
VASRRAPPRSAPRRVRRQRRRGQPHRPAGPLHGAARQQPPGGGRHPRHARDRHLGQVVRGVRAGAGRGHADQAGGVRSAAGHFVEGDRPPPHRRRRGEDARGDPGRVDHAPHRAAPRHRRLGPRRERAGDPGARGIGHPPRSPRPHAGGLPLPRHLHLPGRDTAGQHGGCDDAPLPLRVDPRHARPRPGAGDERARRGDARLDRGSRGEEVGRAADDRRRLPQTASGSGCGWKRTPRCSTSWG